MRGPNPVVSGVAVVLAILLALSYRSGNQFEQRARDAERFASAQRNANAILNDQLSDALARAAKRDTVIKHDSISVAAIDVANPPPDTCKPNLAARDKTIADQKAQILDLNTALARAREIGYNAQQAADSLQTALHARPRALLDLGFIEIGQPKFGAFAGLCSTGQWCYGGGLTFPIRLGGK